MALKDILTLVSVLLGFVTTTLIPTIIVMINRIKAVRKANTEAEKQKAIGEIIELAQGFIVEAEKTWAATDSVLKQSGKEGCGANKKSEVMTQIHQACFDKKLDFDQDFWSNKVEEIVKVTKSVNAKQ